MNNYYREDRAGRGWLRFFPATTKRSFFAIFFLLLAWAGHAQQPETLDPKNDKQDYQGYTIRLIPAEAGGIGYNIFEGNRMVVHQRLNPFTKAPVGLKKKEDAYKAARWLISQWQKETGTAGQRMSSRTQAKAPTPGPMPAPNRQPGGTLYNPSIPAAVAKELSISLQ